MSCINILVTTTLLVLVTLISPAAALSPAATIDRSLHHLRRSVPSSRHPVSSSSSSSSSLFHPIPIPLPSVPPPPPASSTATNTTSSFNESLSMRLLVHSSAAYSTSPFHCTSHYYPSFLHTHTFNTSIYNTSLYGYAGVDNSTHSIVFAFQGSMDVEQLWEELLHDDPVNVTVGSGGGLLVNQYFYVGSTALLPAVTAAYINLTARYTNYTVYWTGHSLGGALAHVLSYLVLSTSTPTSSQPPPVSLYTYGQPRTGNAAFAAMSSLYVPQHYRVVHWRDVIPHLPPCPTRRGGGGVEVCSVSGNETAGYWAYHALQEVWYPSTMPQLVPQQQQQRLQQSDAVVPAPVWTACTGQPTGEDEQCSDGLDIFNPDDHYYYYGVEVGDFCLTGPEKQAKAAAALAATTASVVAVQ